MKILNNIVHPFSIQAIMECTSAYKSLFQSKFLGFAQEQQQQQNFNKDYEYQHLLIPMSVESMKISTQI